MGTGERMHWRDRVYGDVTIDDPGIADLIRTATFQRLRGIRQAGPSALAFPFKVVSRFEHSIGVFVLLRRLGATVREQVAGLLHDLSHTAFSHAVDFVFESVEQAHHEDLKPEFLYRSDIVRGLSSMGFSPVEFEDDTRFGLLERPLPSLCADRVDYFLRDSLTCAVSSPADVAEVLNHLIVVDGTIGIDDMDVARSLARRYRTMNDEWWASPAEAFIYNEFADAIVEAMRAGVIKQADLLLDDEHILACLYGMQSETVRAKLRSIRQFDRKSLEGYIPRIAPKQRVIDPPVLVGGSLIPLSKLG
jgi:HD superfamily phosphohydrolase